MKKILFVVNPKAGVDRVKALEQDIRQHLDHSRFSYRVIHTRYPRHGTDLARSAATEGYAIVAAVGGDGSVNDVIEGLYGTSTCLAIIPKGSGNGLARSLGIPLRTVAAIHRLNGGSAQLIDLGCVNGKLFADNAGVGFDTVVTRHFAESRRRGFMNYLRIILRHLWFYQVRKWDIAIDGRRETQEAFMITAANAVQLGYGFKIAPEADLADGLLDLVIIKKFPKWKAALIALRAFTGTLAGSRYVTIHRVAHILIQHAQVKWVQFDGEAHPTGSPVEISVRPGSLRVWC